jgi:imidazolonepropionase-like amidohydrolase
VVHLGGPSGNVANVYNLRARVAAGVLPGPRIYTSGPIIDGEPAIFPGVSTVARSPEEAASEVRRQLETGADLVKVYNNLRTEALRAVAATAHASSAMVWGHIPRIEGRPTALPRALEAGLDVIAHGEELFFTALYDGVESRLDSGLAPSAKPAALMGVARLVKASGAAVIPNLSFVAMTRTQLDSLAVVWSDPQIRYLHPSILQTWREQNPSRRRDLARFDLRERGKQAVVQKLTATLNDAGVPLLLGTDASAPGMFPGKSAHLELQLLVEAGLTPFEALATGTRNPGGLLRERGSSVASFGILREGSRADLLLLDQNPLADIANVTRVVGVVVRGEWYSRERIDSLRLRAAATFPR